MLGIDFIQDFGLVVLTASLIGWLCRRLRLPLVFGYITAGTLIGPHGLFLAAIEDTPRIHGLAQLGLVFLVFQIGQGLRLQRLKTFGLPLILATLLIAVLVFNGSRLVALSFGWPAVYGLVLAGMLMVSSTAIIGKTLRENNALHSTFGQVALTVTALNDLVAIVMLTLLTIVQTSAVVMPGALLETVFRLVAVMATMVIGAILVVPPLLRRLNRGAWGELQTLFIVGLLLGLALVSSKAGFSPAIGAFLLGTVIASTGHEAPLNRALGGLCDLFGAVFFIAVGMMFDVRLLLEVWPLAVGLFLFALLWRSISVSLALLLVGHKAADAIRSAVCLTPIGEFSLIIALVAAEATLVPNWFYSLAIGLYLFSSLTTPVLLGRPGRISDWLERCQPEFLRKATGFYHDWIDCLRYRRRSNLLWRLTAPRWVHIVVQVLFISGVLILAKPVYELIARSGSAGSASGMRSVLFWIGLVILLLGPLVAVWCTVEATSMLLAEAATRGHRDRVRLQRAFARLLQGAAWAGVFVWTSMFIPYQVLPGWGIVVLVTVPSGLALVFWRKLVRWQSRFEHVIRVHFQESPFGSNGAPATWQKHGRSWRVSVGEHIVGEATRAAGKPLLLLPLRQIFSCTVVGIERQGYQISNPDADTVVYPMDRLLLLGTEDELPRAKRWLEAADDERSSTNGYEHGFAELCLEQLVVPPTSRHIGRSLGELKLNRGLGVQVVGVEQNGDTRVAAGKFDTLNAGDRLLVLGTQRQITDMAFWLST
jgi:CPA2 family monovalent cation:H+ antiporter-2